MSLLKGPYIKITNIILHTGYKILTYIINKVKHSNKCAYLFIKTLTPDKKQKQL